MENVIEINGLSKKYQKFALDNVTLNVPMGSVMGFIGANGAGKSTTIKAILGLYKRDGGEVKVFGEDSEKMSNETREKIGVVFDTMPFPKNLTVTMLDKVLSGIYKTWDSEKFFAYITRFELPLKKKLSGFSRGMEMRLSIAAALSHNPSLLVLDEPTGGLDPVMRSEILDIFLEFMQDETHSILISTHITSDLEHIADYICFINKGKIVFTEERNEMLEKYRIMKCTEEDLQQVDKKDIIGMRKGRFCSEVLTLNADKYPGMVADAPTIEEIMVYYVKEQQS
ncbi:MAG: ABC transporter ATP-binding protein [Ruminiclostridium sp.]|nr:ABC transporter ATP-binding protein [Ruminiclostridium sp.]MBR4111514.1 ABC transporter ATP-binding protein [Ruminiclostridium sp.]